MYEELRAKVLKTVGEMNNIAHEVDADVRITHILDDFPALPAGYDEYKYLDAK